MKRISVAIAFLMLAGCGPKATTVYAPVPEAPKPFVVIEPLAREVLKQTAIDNKLGRQWWVRLEVVWKADPQIEVTVERKPPTETDLVFEADGLRVVFPEDQRVYLKGARITLREVKTGAMFDVTFPNRNAKDIELASNWLRTENEKRKAVKDGKLKEK